MNMVGGMNAAPTRVFWIILRLIKKLERYVHNF